MHVKESIQINDRELTIETGKIAKQADGAVMVRLGDSMVLVTVVAAKTANPATDFLPLTVDYVEKSYAAGRIPGNFFRREGRLSEAEILTSRLIDRPLRPLFPEGWFFETQVVATVVSHDRSCPTEPLAQIGASAALMLSDVPWSGPVAGVQIARVDGRFIAWPTMDQLLDSDMDINIVASRDAIVMVEGELNNLDEETLVNALFFGHEAVQPVLDLQEKLRAAVGRTKRPVPVLPDNSEIMARVRAVGTSRLISALSNKEKLPRYAALDEAKKEIIAELAPEFEGKEKAIGACIGDLKYEMVRALILHEKKRLDGRGLTDVRQITCEVGLLPCVHGSALFTRGETQALVTATLGFGTDNQKMDLLTGEELRNFMLHYNFPPFSVGEAKMMRGPGRREIGHGTLALRAISKVLPSQEDFPYVIRVVSEITESNGSSSMASVCGGTLSLMDCGVPLKAPVAGIAMGLIQEGSDIAVLTDILGDEDHLGDMDFKVAGTATGITAIQMDIKVLGLTREIMSQAIEQARVGRLHILGKMAETLPAPRAELPEHAPRVYTIQISQDKIRDLIGPGGKMIKSLCEQSGAKINVEDSGLVSIATADSEAGEWVVKRIKALCAEPEVGRVYAGYVTRILEGTGAIVEILPGTDGMCHISELDNTRVANVEDIVREGDQVNVLLVEIDRQKGRLRLSRKRALDADPATIIHGLDE
ncbi:MAG: polyribonucleotide nucleotidyltransferase [Deltaproteobacteria bacterium HGW-Deltaproteobacteria-17]|nr:MAG: polyribonucleotide nucleotidyltransferase [Deltaproteobacteria bacterium HGW-Deltaproteobacteria-17]